MDGRLTGGVALNSISFAHSSVAMMAYFYWTVVKSLYVAMKYSTALL